MLKVAKNEKKHRSYIQHTNNKYISSNILIKRKKSQISKAKKTKTKQKKNSHKVSLRHASAFLLEQQQQEKSLLKR